MRSALQMSLVIGQKRELSLLSDQLVKHLF